MQSFRHPEQQRVAVGVAPGLTGPAFIQRCAGKVCDLGDQLIYCALLDVEGEQLLSILPIKARLRKFPERMVDLSAQ